MSGHALQLKSLPAAPGADARDREPSAESGCPDEALLLELSQGAIGGASFDSLLTHLDRCAECSRIVAELAREAVPEHLNGSSEAREAMRPKPGGSIDRFLLLDELGRGGMGVVYAAFDPTLDRKVALKLVRPAPSLPARSAAAHLLAEAQALARLSHPNVVTVFEARACGDEVFLVMELIAGRSLRELAESRPGFRVLLERFAEAGRGLQAAHDAGLVHRDFKPDNALLGDDGRVCVTDFGLAQQNRPLRPTRAEPAGTPGYIAPELWLGQPAGPRSDQFSFSVSLWEALFGARPFTADRPPLLLEQIRRGPLLSLHSSVPLSVRRALLRGLRFDPSERHPSMRALLEELVPVPSARWSAPLLATLGLALVGSGAGAHALWLDAHTAQPASAVMQASLPGEPAKSDRLCVGSTAAESSSSYAERFARESFSKSGSTDLERASALALVIPPARPRPARAAKPVAHRARPQPAEKISDGLARAADEGRDGGIGGGGSSLDEPKGSSSVVPESDPLTSTRTLR